MTTVQRKGNVSNKQLFFNRSNGIAVALEAMPWITTAQNVIAVLFSIKSSQGYPIACRVDFLIYYNGIRICRRLINSTEKVHDNSYNGKK